MANGVDLNIVNWTGVGLSTVVFAVRAYTRFFIARSIGLDDLFMLLSLLASFAAAGLITAAVHYGLGGQGMPSLLASKYSFLSGIPVLIAQAFGRVSFAFTLLSVLGVTRARQWFLYVIIAFQFIFLSVVLALSYGLCSPVSVFWDPNASESEECLIRYHTVVVDRWNFFQTAWDAGTDLVLALFPALIFSTMNMKLRLKIGLICLMGLGVFASIATIVKAIEFATLYQATGGSNYAQATIFIWTVIQVYVVIIAASLPYCRALFSRNHGETTVGPAPHGQMNLRRKRPKHLDESSQQHFIPLSGHQSH
ncbi:hypothetical protein GGR51DRAFT_506031, partial [Nemania sp. FL0031]